MLNIIGMHCLEDELLPRLHAATRRSASTATKCAVFVIVIWKLRVCSRTVSITDERRPGYYFKLLISCASEISTICSFIINESAPVLNEASLQRVISYAAEKITLLCGGGEFAFPPTAHKVTVVQKVSAAPEEVFKCSEKSQ